MLELIWTSNIAYITWFTCLTCMTCMTCMNCMTYRTCVRCKRCISSNISKDGWNRQGELLIGQGLQRLAPLKIKKSSSFNVIAKNSVNTDNPRLYFSTQCANLIMKLMINLDTDLEIKPENGCNFQRQLWDDIANLQPPPPPISTYHTPDNG